MSCIIYTFKDLNTIHLYSISVCSWGINFSFKIAEIYKHMMTDTIIDLQSLTSLFLKKKKKSGKQQFFLEICTKI
jgi:hypothetical protein